LAITEQKVSNYFGLSEEFSAAENSQAIIVPVPYERTSKGTKNAPKAILEASQNIDLFDDELWVEPHKIGIHSAPSVIMPPQGEVTEKPFQEVYSVIEPLIEINKFPICIGGEHAISIGAVRACVERYKDLSVLQIDAKADLSEPQESCVYSDSSAAHHMYKVLANPLLTQVGVRNISAKEVAWMEETHPKINIFWARQQAHWNLHEIVDTLSENVYLTIDVSGLDPSIMPATKSPEPGGMNWYQLIELIKIVCIRKNVVAADIVELAPIASHHAPDFLVAKLLYKLIGHRFALDLGVTKKY
jgi:agmatinase